MMSTDVAQGELVFAPSHQALRRFDDPDKWLPVAEALALGKSLAEAAKLVGLRPNNLTVQLARSPELLDEIKRFRQALDEVNLISTAALMHQRVQHALDKPKDQERMSNRDLTDIRRASKPFDQESGARIKITLDLPV
jgi:hypothetical protein